MGLWNFQHECLALVLRLLHSMVKSSGSFRGRTAYRGSVVKRTGLLRKGKHNKSPLVVRRKWQLLFSLLFVTVLVVFWPKLSFWLNQPIRRVEVHAPFRFLQKDQIEQLLVPFLGQRFFQLDMAGVQYALADQPWVGNVAISKGWPDQLVVTLTEKEAVARWYDQQLITGDGEVFSPADISRFAVLPVLRGPRSQARAVMSQYLAISQLLRPMGLVVSELELSSAGAWRFNIGTVQVYLGRDERMVRLQRLVRLYHARLESRWDSVRRIDLRYTNGAAVAWRGRE